MDPEIRSRQCISAFDPQTHFQLIWLDQNLTQPIHFIIRCHVFTVFCIYYIIHLDLDLVVRMKYLDIDPVIEMSKKMGSFLRFFRSSRALRLSG